ncbi:caspase, EACC1-associated type [Nostoc sp.]|uniref:caspase, EACC1-associated type n=1 Tax=Nostoc sp. TaxID=1180 RepID=UPI002FF4BEE7
MAKVALLIGVSEYEPGLTPLPAATKDVEAMQRVLQNPEIGGFDEVKVLVNPRRQAMEEAIETLFDSRQRDDLVLLFFSGHGIKDESGKLYFSTCNTRKNLQGRLFETTAVAASSVHKFMTNSRSRQQVVILDCCFSGAFAEGMVAKEEGFVDVRNQLSGEGRAVLTSSTSTQYSFEQQGADTSTYTRYIVEGLETGAADWDEDGWISVDELHDYAAKKVQEATPAMKPEIYPVKGGYKIKLAKAPTDDPTLKYRREVEYWVEGGNGEISFTGRAALDARQETLKLSPEEAVEIETQVLAPIEDKKRKLQRYELAFRDEIKQGFPPSDKTRANLKRLQQASGLRDEDIALIEVPIIAEQRSTLPLVNPPRPRNRNFLEYVGVGIIGLIGVFIGGTLVYFLLPRTIIIGSTLITPPTIVPTPGNYCAKDTYSVNDNISLGEEILEKQDTNSDKKAGANEFFKGKCKTAIDKFNSYRRAKLTDPEALIYLNNAKARQQGERLKIAVSVPIDTDPDLAEEILRGVAQAQDEVNNNNGIKGKLLQVAIANDDEKPGTATKIAEALAGDPEILGVVGAASSNATLEAGRVYTNKRLVAISPTSTSVSISGFSPYIFRTVFSDKLAAKELANYMVKILHKKNAAVFFNSSNLYSKSLKDEFLTAVQKKDVEVSPENQFDLNSYNFDADNAVKQAITQDAVLMLISDSETLEKAGKVIQANNHELHIFGGDNIFSLKTLNSWGKQVEGMVVAVPWDIGNASNLNFVNNSKNLWKYRVNWRTATAYDATQAIIAGLRKSNTREGLKQELHKSDFSFDGATEKKIQFLPSGDRKDNPIFLVKVQQKPGTDTYEFVPIQP